MEDGFRISLISPEAAEQRGRWFVAPGHTFLEVDAHPGIADLLRGEQQRLADDLNRNGLGLLLNGTERGNHAEQGRRNGSRSPPKASSSGARYNCFLAVVHVSPQLS
jgi:hypothetical protein